MFDNYGQGLLIAFLLRCSLKFIRFFRKAVIHGDLESRVRSVFIDACFSHTFRNNSFHLFYISLGSYNCFMSSQGWAKLGISVPQMTIIFRRRFTVGRLTQTLLKYIFSESLIIVDYDGVFTNIRKIKVSRK